MKKSIVLILSVCILSGCAARGSNYIPIVDLKNKNYTNFTVDVSECQAYARKSMSASQGALLGAFVGILASAITGGNRRNRNRAIALGATTGAIKTNDTQESIVKRCLRGRGYTVLN